MSGLQVYAGWYADSDLLDQVRAVFSYGPGDDRATGYLYSEGEQTWPDALADLGPGLRADLDTLLGVQFTHVAFQAYLNGSGCDWHADTPFDAQAILSLGQTRTFGVRPVGGEPEWVEVAHGDLVYMPNGFQTTHEHCVPREDATGERVSLVFRTVART